MAINISEAVQRLIYAVNGETVDIDPVTSGGSQSDPVLIIPSASVDSRVQYEILYNAVQVKSGEVAGVAGYNVQLSTPINVSHYATSTDGQTFSVVQEQMQISNFIVQAGLVYIMDGGIMKMLLFTAEELSNLNIQEATFSYRGSETVDVSGCTAGSYLNCKINKLVECTTDTSGAPASVSWYTDSTIQGISHTLTQEEIDNKQFPMNALSFSYVASGANRVSFICFGSIWNV